MGGSKEPVAVIGSGTIGRSWSVVFARAGHPVRLYDAVESRSREAAAGAAAAIGFLADRGWLAEPPDEVVARISSTASLAEACAGAIYVQESVPEDLDVKRQVFGQLEDVAPADLILGSSASAIPMSSIAEGLRHPERCLVVHPTNPPHLLPLVELVPSPVTSPDVLETTRQLMIRAGQRPIVCRREVYGFVLNRLQFALFKEALSLARDGVASIPDIDACITDGLGLRWAFMGPFMVEETNADSVGDCLFKFRDFLHTMMSSLARDVDGPDDADIERATVGIAVELAGRTHDDMVSYRDEMVLQLRRLRGEEPPGGGSR
jgi:L-gulonate 3-dehydrogenase